MSGRTIQQLPANARGFTPGRNQGSISLLVMHATAGARASDIPILRAQQLAFAGAGWVSVHYYVQTDGVIMQFVQEADQAWHAGASSWPGATVGNSCNQRSIGIELENSNNGRDAYPQPQMDSAVWLARDILGRRSLARDRCVTHYMISPNRKFDPRPPAWNHDNFLAAVAGQPQPQPQEGVRVYQVEFNACIIRQGPNQRFPEAGRMNAGERFESGGITFGQVIQGSDEWIHLRDQRGFMHSSLVSRA